VWSGNGTSHHSKIGRSTSELGQIPKLPHRNSNGRFTSISRHYACTRSSIPVQGVFTSTRKKLTCSGHAANSRRYRDLGSTCLCRGREWVDLNGVAKVGQSPPPGLRRRRGAPVNKKSRKRAPGPMTARGDSLGYSRNPGSYSHQANERPRCRRRAASLTSFHSLRVGNAGGRLVCAADAAWLHL
jgi:hypothetical protein